MARRRWVGLLVLLTLPALAASGDPFAFFTPTAIVTGDDLGQLNRGEPIARILPAKGLEVAIFAAVPVNIDGNRLLSWMRQIEALKKSAYVLAIGRFSNPPRIEDVAGLSIDDEDLSAIRACRPRSCAVKLSADEMTDLQKAATESAGDWKAPVQDAFRRLVLKRVQTYLATGQTPAYQDQRSPVSPAERFTSLLQQSAFLAEHLPRLGELLRNPPSPTPGVESFFYWSKERLVRKAVISVTYVVMTRGHKPGEPDAIVASKDIYATHYVEGSFAVTALMRGDPGRFNYLAYLNRSEVDVLRSSFMGLVRLVMQRRLKAEAASVLAGLRRRLESGEPPMPILTQRSP